MEIDLFYGSSLLVLLSDVNKMKLLKTYIDEIPDDIMKKEVKNQLKECVSSGDEVLYATLFHEQGKLLKEILVALLKASHRAQNLDELREMMNTYINSVKYNNE